MRTLTGSGWTMLTIRRACANAILACVVVTATAARAGAAAAPASRPAARVEHRVHSGAGWAIAAPAEWTTFAPAIKPPMILYLNGDGKGGVPMFDGTLGALQIG